MGKYYLQRNLLFVVCAIAVLYPVPSQSQDLLPYWKKENLYNHAAFIPTDAAIAGSICSGERVSKPGFMMLRAGLQIYFSPDGVRYVHGIEVPFKEREKEEEEREKESVSVQNDQQNERHDNFQSFSVTWPGSNPNVKISSSDELPYSFYFSSSNGNAIRKKAFRTITYHDLYKGIDLVYSATTSGGTMKYSFIVHPNADPSQIKMKFNGAAVSALNNQLLIQSEFGVVREQPPVTFYQGSQKKQIRSSFFVASDIVSFRLDRYDASQTLVIDPLVITPSFSGVYNRAYDVEYDDYGNSYVYGGSYYFEEHKYDSTGALQWVYVASLVDYYYGDFTVNAETGTSYIAEGFTAGGARVLKISSNGLSSGLFTGDMNFREMWRIEYNYCTQQLIGAGGGTIDGSYQGYILDSNCVGIQGVNMLGAEDFGHDICLLALDNSNNCFMATARAVVHWETFDNILFKTNAASLSPVDYMVDDNHSFEEVTSIDYTGGTQTNGFNGIAVNSKFVFTYDGKRLQRWEKNSGALLNSVLFPSAPFDWGGLAADDCGNVYVGYQNSIRKLDTAFVNLATYILPGTIYDLKIGNNDELHAAGEDFIIKLSTGVFCNDLNLSAWYIPGQCYTPSNIIQASVSGGVPPYTYDWSASGAGSGPSVTGLPPGNYTLTVKDAGCRSNPRTVALSIFENPVAAITASELICANDSSSVAKVTVDGGAAPYAYSWLSNSSVDSVAAGLWAAEHQVIVTSAEGCSDTAAITILPPVSPFEVLASVVEQPDPALGSSGLLSASAEGAYEWWPAEGLSCTDCASPVAEPQVTTSYCVKVVADNGCIDTDCATVYVSSFYIPNAFTPDGNNLNDLYRPVLRSVHDYSFMIFDRWGALIFETNDPASGWDGCLQGRPCEQNTYVYKVSYRDDAQNRQHDYTGSVTLVR